ADVGFQALLYVRKDSLPWGRRFFTESVRGADVVDPRTTSWGRTRSSVLVGRRLPSPEPSRARTADCAMSGTSWRTVVSAGVVSSAQPTPSWPTTDTSSGTEAPMERAPSIVPAAMASLPQAIAVTPRPS